MNKFTVLLLSASFIWSTALQAFDHSHAGFAEVLQKHVTGKLVNYESLKDGGVQALDAYLSDLAEVQRDAFDQWSQEEQLAYYLNLYNAAVLKLVTDHYPVNSIQRIPNRWDIRVVELFGEKVSLDDIEHGVIRKDFAEPRIHFALVCAALGCPPLRGEPFVADRLDAQLDSQGERFLRDQNWNWYDAESGTLYLSGIFDWFRADFEKDGQDLLAFLRSYLPEAASEQIPEGARIEFSYYDWSLNEVGAEPLPQPPIGAQVPVMTGMRLLDYLGPREIRRFEMAYLLAAFAWIGGAIISFFGGFVFGYELGLPLVLVGLFAATLFPYLLGRYSRWEFLDITLARRGMEGMSEDKESILTQRFLSQRHSIALLAVAYGRGKIPFLSVVKASILGNLAAVAAFLVAGVILKQILLAAAGDLSQPGEWLWLVGLLALLTTAAVRLAMGARQGFASSR